MRRWARVAIAVSAMAGVAAGLRWLVRDDFALPREIATEDVIADLSASLEAASAIEQAPGHPVRLGGLQPSPYLDGHGGYRRAIIAPPPSVIRFRVRPPEGAALRLAEGVAKDSGRDRSAAGVRFAVHIDGRAVLSRSINPAHSRHHRRWFEERLDLSAAAGREVEIALTTHADGSGSLAGTSGWSNVRIVRPTTCERLRARPDAPSVLVLLIDALRADRLGCYGALPSPTPVLDALAAGGLVFERAIAQASWTMPAVTSILTGLYPRAHGVVGGSWTWGEPPGVEADADWAFLSDVVPTLAAEAARAGVTTVGVVGNPTISRGTNLARGFETFVELTGEHTRTRWVRAAEINDTFLRWLRRNRGLRFLAYLHYMDVHGPYDPPPPFHPPTPTGVRGAVARGDVEQLQGGIRCGGPLLDDDEVAYLKALYQGGLRYWDRELARFLRGLDGLGVRGSTIVIVMADHGEEFQEHGRLEHGTQLYDETLRVPLVIAGPGVARGRVTEQAQQIDIFPTVAAMLGVPGVPGLPGQDLLAGRTPRPVFSETRYGTGPSCRSTEMRSVRTDAWKLIETPALGRLELYDLRSDPGEREDRFGGAPEGQMLATELAEWWTTTRTPPAVAGRDPHLFQKLRQLGYVQ